MQHSALPNSAVAFRAKIDSHLFGLNSCQYLLSTSHGAIHTSNRGVKSECQGNDSLAYVDGNGRETIKNEGEDSSAGFISEPKGVSDGEQGETEEVEVPTVGELRELLQKAITELEVARINSTMFEEKAQKISEAAIALKDEATNAWNDVNDALDTIQDIISDELIAKEALQKSTMTLSLAEARLHVALESIEANKEGNDAPERSTDNGTETNLWTDDERLLDAQVDIRECRGNLEKCEAELRNLQIKREELQKEVDRLNEVAQKAQLNALKAEEDVANIMLLAEQAVAFELEAAQRVNDAEISLQRAEKSLANSGADSAETVQGNLLVEAVVVDEVIEGGITDVRVGRESDVVISSDTSITELSLAILADKTSKISDKVDQSLDLSDQENGKVGMDSPKEDEAESEKSKAVQSKKLESQKDLTWESSSMISPKALLKKSSRFFPASFFSSTDDGEEFTPALVFQGLIDYTRKQLPKLVLGLVLLGAGYVNYFASSYLVSAS